MWPTGWWSTCWGQARIRDGLLHPVQIGFRDVLGGKEMFSFQAKTRIVFGANAVEILGRELKALGAKKVLVVTDEGVIKAGLFEKVEASLLKDGIKVAVFDDVEPNPRDTTIIRGAQCMKDAKADAVLGFGGGSPIDVAKAISVMSVNEGPIGQYCAAFDCWPNPPKPIVAVPTTAGTGSEVSAASIITDTQRGIKMMMLGRSIQPVTAIVDPVLTIGLSPHLTAQTGVDALSHAVEACVSIGANPISDAVGFQAVELIVNNIRKAYTNGKNLEARTNVMLGSTMAMMAAANAGLGIVHSMAHALGGQYDISHGLSIAACFPDGLEYSAIAVPEKCARMAQVMGKSTVNMSPVAAAKTVVDAIRELIENLGLEQDLESLGVERESFPNLAEICMADGCTMFSPRTIDAGGFIGLYERAYEQTRRT